MEFDRSNRIIAERGKNPHTERERITRRARLHTTRGCTPLGLDPTSQEVSCEIFHSKLECLECRVFGAPLYRSISTGLPALARMVLLLTEQQAAASRAKIHYESTRRPEASAHFPPGPGTRHMNRFRSQSGSVEAEPAANMCTEIYFESTLRPEASANFPQGPGIRHVNRFRSERSDAVVPMPGSRHESLQIAQRCTRTEQLLQSIDASGLVRCERGADHSGA